MSPTGADAAAGAVGSSSSGMLDRAALLALIATAKRLDLFVLIETFDAADIAVARDLIEAPEAQGARLLIGVNSRDLTTLKVVPGRLEALLPELPTNLPRVAESGIATAEDAARLSACGYEMALIGGALMTAADPAVLLRAMLAGGRGARSK